jgi:hypothetical protein
MNYALLPAINQLPANIATVDLAGVIVAVNNGWKLFARENGLADPACCVGTNYIELCERSDVSPGLLAELRQMLSGERAMMTRWYPCHRPNGPKRWFVLVGIRDDRAQRVTLAHLDVGSIVDQQTMARLEATGDDLPV